MPAPNHRLPQQQPGEKPPWSRGPSRQAVEEERAFSQSQVMTMTSLKAIQNNQIMKTPQWFLKRIQPQPKRVLFQHPNSRMWRLKRSHPRDSLNWRGRPGRACRFWKQSSQRCTGWLPRQRWKSQPASGRDLIVPVRWSSKKETLSQHFILSKRASVHSSPQRIPWPICKIISLENGFRINDSGKILFNSDPILIGLDKGYLSNCLLKFNLGVVGPKSWVGDQIVLDPKRPRDFTVVAQTKAVTLEIDLKDFLLMMP